MSNTFRINNNVGALQAYYQLSKINEQTQKAQLRLSSGKRIQNVADDTSGFNIGSSLERKVTTMISALGNIGAAKDMLATAEGALMGISDLLTKIEGKMADAQDPTKDRTALASDITALAREIDNILKSTRFNDTNLLSGAGAAGAGTKAQNFVFQIGANYDETMTINFATGVAASGGYDSAFSASLSNFYNASAGSIATDTSTTLQANLTTLKNAITTALGSIGNFVQRLDVKKEFLDTAIANTKSSTSRIFDTDYALETLNAMRGQILSQSALAMLAQLNAMPQNVLMLFK